MCNDGCVSEPKATLLRALLFIVIIALFVWAVYPDNHKPNKTTPPIELRIEQIVPLDTLGTELLKMNDGSEFICILVEDM